MTSAHYLKVVRVEGQGRTLVESRSGCERIVCPLVAGVV